MQEKAPVATTYADGIAWGAVSAPFVIHGGVKLRKIMREPWFVPISALEGDMVVHRGASLG